MTNSEHDNPVFEASETESEKVSKLSNSSIVLNLEEVPKTNGLKFEKKTSDKEEFINIFNFHKRIGALKSVSHKLKIFRTKGYIKLIISVILILCYLLYFVTALTTTSLLDKTDYWCNGDGFLIINTSFFGSILIYFQIIKPFFGDLMLKILKKPLHSIKLLASNRIIKILFYALAIGSYFCFLITDAEDLSRLTSAFGTLVLLLVATLFSKYPTEIKFERIFWGIALQVFFALLILRWSFGKQLFQCLGSKVSNFLSFTDAGTIFAIGDFLNDTNSYAFKILPVILYFGLFVSILYHFGIIQWVIIKLGWVLQIIVGTTPCESMATVANIFLGMSEAPLVIKPYISLLTKSEIHTIMTGGFATVAGGVLAAYISFGIEPAHLLSASIMSAPAALTMSKLFYPEVEKSQTKHENIKIIRDKEKNIIHVIMTDLKDNIQLIAIITSCLVIFIGAAAFLNAFSDWGCQTLGYDEGVCEIQKFLGYLLYPVAWLMGVPSEDCHFVGYLLGMKIFVTEFLAYKELANKFKQGLVSARSVVIATYALCGFSSVPSMTCAVGALGCLAPSRIKDVSQVVVRAFIAGNFACILTACVAGTLIDDPASRLSAFQTNSANSSVFQST
ncbi:UNVERIFIED_CONTAM: hypothetical protein RMT77_005976 [Armadillidium vulgare]